ncbi:hypothetical protein [Helicobacter ailurogastricus]|uniref:Uncharacterized protein n=1 Tax=Helicobacter ailurogastricus TaxID=1578720 RepID=A0A0K2X362_9HELI|nr:hypothetical protein [Helicobacter ailurogastricus]BDQ28423.1 hypothetical protein ASB7_02600 [Helicobacter ailurogastricus]CRF41340.1 hypothetical protein HAL011_11340 [Helicobacter ailurogastricus]CRF42043.1 hypothetical protein HAL013_01920 [Helicobacter ailurogastricus]CRF43591.1 hypothetical protein HAL09_01370 [Helicobacter ailurogastricus]
MASDYRPEYKTLAQEEVQHISGTDRYIPSYGEPQSWIDFYRKYSNLSVLTCCYLRCTQEAVIGAHVKVKSIGNKYFIVPVCKSHNPKGNQTFTVNSGTRAVPQVLENQP